MAFKARKVKKGFFEVHGIEAYIEKKVAELRRTFSTEAKKFSAEAKKVAKVVKQRTKAAEKAVGKVTAKIAPASVVDRLNRALTTHPRKDALVKAGRAKDQLMRALIPLYLARGWDVEITSGATSKLWKKYGVTFAPPNAAKALREHVGYARRTKAGLQITPNGVKYVEQAFGAKKKAA
jgi:hypothetical protein